jgi:cytochrome c-type biogenesis protein CcsB
MLNKIKNLLFSTRLTAVLFIVFAASMAVGTFLDQGQETSPTPYSRTLIYNAWWFEAIMGVFLINFVGNIFRYRLYLKEKWATLTLHLSFIFILLGAFVTRYYSFEGMMAIREGATENKFLSQKNYLTTYIDGDFVVDGVPQRRVRYDEVDFSPRLNNKLRFSTDYNDQPVNVELDEIIFGAEEDIVPDENGEYMFKIVEAQSGRQHNHYLKSGTVTNIHGMLYALNRQTEGAVNITHTDDTLTINSPFAGQYMVMATKERGVLFEDSIQPLRLRSQYVIGNQTVVFPKPVMKSRFDVVKKSEILKGDEDAIVLKVTANGETQIVKLLGGPGINNAFKQAKIGGLDFAFKYGPKVLELPFSLKLNDFIAERYPGTQNSYSTFESKVTVIDKQEGDFDFHIYMNNILNHRGYRFFQSSFDPDELGTILSVNHDWWGTNLTYLGYILLYFGLLAILFSKHTRFADLKKQLRRVKKNKSKLATVAILAFGLMSYGQEPGQDDEHVHENDVKIILDSKTDLDSILALNIAPVEHAAKFGELVVQDFDGRMKPMNTYSSELLRKLTKFDHYQEFNSDQVFLSMMESPLLWWNTPVIYLKKKKADTIRSLIGVDVDSKYATLAQFFTKRGEYKLAPFLEEAYKAQIPTGIQKEFKETDQRVNLLYNTLEGRTIKLFPIPEDANNTWTTPKDYVEKNLIFKDTMYGKFVKTGFLAYLGSLQQSKQNGNYVQTDQLLDGIKKVQKLHGAEVVLTEDKIKTEILYNKYDIFKRLFSWYMYAGTLMFILLIVQIFKYKSRPVNLGVKVFKYTIVGLFVLHTAGLIVRWYISGHAPWSDAYESMIYVAWATMLFGLIFGRKSELTVAATAFVTSMILMIAHWNWMDPSIGNIQPVLNSYWLMIHVSIIVGSYGPFTLGMILGLVTLLLMILTNKENSKRMWLNIKELTTVNEMALTVGLVMLTIGNFLGGMWANESWGRYWGWDPKETWALISIMIYAFVIHMRLVPGLRGRFIFNVTSVYAYASILMTYFGVNFYLAGLHSYARDDQEISVYFIGGSIIAVAILAFLAKRKYNIFFR